MARRPRTDRTVEYLPLADLKPARRNPKLHDLPTIKASIVRFGLGGPACAVDERTGRLVWGHGRRAALLELHADASPPPDGVQVADDGTWLVPVARGWRSRNNAEAEAYLLADNHTTEVGGWDRQLRAEMLADLGVDRLEGTGFTIDDLPPRPTGDDEDNPALIDPPADPVSAAGDLWHLGPHRLAVGSSTDPATWDLLAPPPADLVWTDPPYGINYEKSSPGQSSKTRRRSTITNDDLSVADLQALLDAAFDLTVKVACRPGTVWFVAAPGGPQFLATAQVLTRLGIWRQTIAWVKDRLVLGRSDYHGQHEPIAVGALPGPDPVPLYDDAGDVIAVGWTPGAAHQRTPDRRQTTVWEVPRPGASDDHPTMKPVELIARAIRNHTRPGGIVVDPFAGSGSTLIAAGQLDRTAYLIELDPAYADVICRRYEAATGDTPTRNGRPHTFREAP